MNCNDDLKICDYGLAGDEFHTCPMTEYVFTRWYRAPEVLCSWADYGKPIDLRTVSCILAEMLKRRPNEKCRKIIVSATGGRLIEEMMASTSGEALHLPQMGLQLNPERRTTCDEVMDRPRGRAALHCGRRSGGPSGWRIGRLCGPSWRS